MGRPPVDSSPVMVRMLSAELAALDAWITRQDDPKLTRPVALRRLAMAAIEKGRPPVKRPAR